MVELLWPAGPLAVICMPAEMGMFIGITAAAGKSTTTEVGIMLTARRPQLPARRTPNEVRTTAPAPFRSARTPTLDNPLHHLYRVPRTVNSQISIQNCRTGREEHKQASALRVLEALHAADIPAQEWEGVAAVDVKGFIAHLPKCCDKHCGKARLSARPITFDSSAR